MPRGRPKVAPALRTRSPNGIHWSVRSMAEHTGVSKGTAARWFHVFGIRPHREKPVGSPDNPFLVEKARDTAAADRSRA